MDAAEGFDRLVKQEDAGHEGEEFGGGETGGEDVEEGKSDAEGGNDLDKWGGDFRVFEHAHRIAELVHDRVVEELHHEPLAAERFDHPDAGEGFLQDDVHFAGQLLLGASRFAHFAAIHGHRHNADREEDKGHEAEFPVDPHDRRDAGNQGNGLFKEVDADLREGALGHTGIAEDARHEPAGLGFVKEALALVDDAGEEFAADVVEDAEADPRHFVGVEVGEEAAQNHDERHEQADPQDCLEPGARAGCGSFGNLLLVRASGENAIADQLDDQGNRTVNQSEEDAHPDTKKEAAFVGFDVGQQLGVRLPVAAEAGRFGRVGHGLLGASDHNALSSLSPCRDIKATSAMK